MKHAVRAVELHRVRLALPALAVFLWLLVRIFWDTVALYVRTSDRWAKGLALGFLGSIAAFILSNAYENELYHPNVSSYFWILAALVVSLGGRQEAGGTKQEAAALPAASCILPTSVKNERSL